MDCNIAEKFDFVSPLAAEPLAAALRGTVSTPAAPVPGFNPTLMVHQPVLEAFFPEVRASGVREEAPQTPCWDEAWGAQKPVCSLGAFIPGVPPTRPLLFQVLQYLNKMAGNEYMGFSNAT